MGVHETIYDAVTYQNRVGALSLTENQLCHHTPEKVSVLPWKKVVRRQVATAASVSTPMFKLILKSGTEAIFKMEDRISLEVLRDDLGERLKTYRKLHPEECDEEPAPRAVNKTRASFSGRRSSTPYSMSVPQREYIYSDSDNSSVSFADDVSEMSDSTAKYTTHTTGEGPTKYSPKLNPVKEDRRASTGGPAFRRTYSGEAKVQKTGAFRRSYR